MQAGFRDMRRIEATLGWQTRQRAERVHGRRQAYGPSRPLPDTDMVPFTAAEGALPLRLAKSRRDRRRAPCAGCRMCSQLPRREGVGRRSAQAAGRAIQSARAAAAGAAGLELTHPDLRQTARVRAFMQFVGDALVQRLRTS